MAEFAGEWQLRGKTGDEPLERAEILLDELRELDQHAREPVAERRDRREELVQELPGGLDLLAMREPAMRLDGKPKAFGNRRGPRSH